tara:strand:- start:385 stop:738 length:354 start_codon:yes stop_codon:yes gene_type:complete
LKKVEKPWGHEIIWANSDRIAGKVLYIKKGHRLSLQYHEKKEEAIYVMQGSLVLTTVDKTTGDPVEKVLCVGTSHHVYPGDVHRFEARDEDVVLVEVSTPELSDVVRIEDDYKREKN